MNFTDDNFVIERANEKDRAILAVHSDIARRVLITETHRQFLRYAMIGLVSNAILYGAYLLLTSHGIGHKTAMTILYAVGVLQTFIFNRRWTFRHRGEIAGSMTRYIATYAFGYVGSAAAMYLFVDLIGLPHQAVMFVLIFATACCIFLLQKFWVFPAKNLESSS
jgi:putative flippase GtrA